MKHKLLFSLMMAVSNLQMHSFLPAAELKILMTGVGESLLEEDQRAVPSFLTNKTWQTVRHLAASVGVFQGLDVSMNSLPEQWAAYA